MEGRLTTREPASAADFARSTELQPSRDSEESVVAADAAARSLNGTESESINVWPDETAEASFMAEARERGEPIAATPARASAIEENDPKNLPTLDELVNRIPAEVRDVLDDLFRAKFTSVRRLPAKSFKG